MTVSFEVKMDIDSILKNKIEKPATEVFFNIAEFFFRSILTEAKNRTGSNPDGSSPVFTGRYRGSHTVALNRIDKTVLPEITDKQGFTIQGIQANNFPDSKEVFSSKTKFKFGDILHFANSVPYADLIEEGLASTKTPQGVFNVAAEATKARYSGSTILSRI